MTINPSLWVIYSHTCGNSWIKLIQRRRKVLWKWSQISCDSQLVNVFDNEHDINKGLGWFIIVNGNL